MIRNHYTGIYLICDESKRMKKTTDWYKKSDPKRKSLQIDATVWNNLVSKSAIEVFKQEQLNGLDNSKAWWSLPEHK